MERGGLRLSMKREPYLGKAAYTKAILKAHGIHARKRYGQNFLIDEDVLWATVDAAGICEEDFVLEIGPGIGTLTQYLSYRAGKVLAIEIDTSLLPVLADTLSGYPDTEILTGDFMKIDLPALLEEKNGGRPVKVAANLPYYITTPILMKLLEAPVPITDITVMVQKEVADRMTAGPGSKDYGALSLAVQYRARPEVVRVVHPSSFMPQPGVDSAVVHLSMYETPPVSCADEELLLAVIRAAFNQRRKKLANAVANAPGIAVSRETVEEALITAGLRADARGEMLSLSDFAALTDAIADRRG